MAANDVTSTLDYRSGEGHQFESGQAHFYIKSGESIKSNIYPRIFFSVLFLAIILMAFYITRPFLPVLVTGAIVAYLLYPVYLWLQKYVKNRNAASFIISLAAILVITVPFTLVIGLVSKEAIATYSTLDQHQLGTNFAKIMCGNPEWKSCKSLQFLVGFLPNKNLDYYIQSSIEKITGFIIDNVYSFIYSIPSILLNIFVLAFVIYYLLKDGQIISRRIVGILPLKEAHKKNVFEMFHKATYAVFYSNIAVAIVQGALGGIGFFALGVPSPVLWGAVMAIFALVPYFGSAIIWLPAAINMIFEGYLQNNNSLTAKGIALIIYGIIFISIVDNFLKPKIISSKSDIHPILVLLGVLGGLNLFGFLGLILGPIMLALLVTFVEIYEEEKAELEKYF